MSESRHCLQMHVNEVLVRFRCRRMRFLGVHLRQLEVQDAELHTLAAKDAQRGFCLSVHAGAPRRAVMQQLILAEVEVVCEEKGCVSGGRSRIRIFWHF